MTTPSVTLKSLQNEDTGIDINVPRFKEEEAPLGGISILYEITVLTRLDLFKTRLHKSGDVVQFTLFKAYREIEDLYSKLNKKYPKANLPPVPKTSSAAKYSDEDKVEALDQFMAAIAKNTEICYSSTFTQFIGINSHRMPSFTVPTESNDTSDDTNNIPKQKVAESDNDASTDIPEVFPKVKSSVVGKNQSAPAMKKVDLFDEAKLTSSTNVTVNVKKSSQGLFDDFEDESLFSSKPAEKAPPVVKEEIKPEPATEARKQSPKRKSKESPVQNIDDSQIIIKDRKQGEVSLFTEQDLGEYITKEEEELFLVTSPNTEAKRNSLLFTENEILSPDSDKNLNDNLDDLLNLEPLPNTPLPRKASLQQEAGDRPIKPVPLPRRKSLGKTETDAMQKPEVMPRKVFLNKTDHPPQTTVRPPVPTKPSRTPPTVQAKPTPPTKPKPPPKKPKPSAQTENKTKDLDAANANNSAQRTEKNPDNLSNLVGDLQDLDILKYIEQEEKSLDAQLNLFD